MKWILIKDGEKLSTDKGKVIVFNNLIEVSWLMEHGKDPNGRNPFSDCKIEKFEGELTTSNHITYKQWISGDTDYVWVKTMVEAFKNVLDVFMIIRHDDKWRYPAQNDDQRTCPMLDFMFQVEKHPGYLIFVPDPPINKQAPVKAIGHKDLFGKTKDKINKEVAGQE